MTRSLLACTAILTLLSGCGGGAVMHGPTPFAIGLAVATPPLNTIIFGCDDEFGMPDSRRKDCELHYHLTGRDAPWEVQQKYLAATEYQPGELQCTRTRGKIVDCVVVSGAPRRPSWIAAPNNLGSE